MQEKKTCSELEELQKIVKRVHPFLLKKSHYFGYRLTPGVGLGFVNRSCGQLAKLLWGMLAGAMRYADEMREAEPPEGKKLHKLLEPFSSDIVDAGYDAKDVSILDVFLFEKKRDLPFGTIAVDAKGIVIELKVKRLFED